jgi:ABC-type antimicrobial peptide transport system permease subunit
LSIVSDLDSELAVDAPEPMSAKVARATARQRFVAGLGLAFAGLAIVLSAAGLYGITAYAVSRRTREVGLRMALGADRSRVLFEVVASGLVLIGTALGLGLGAALAGGRLVAGLLYELRPADPGTLTAAAATVAAVALIAVLVPAARAARLDPARCLRYE